MNKQLLLVRQGSNISVSDMAKLLDMSENDYLEYEIGGKSIDDKFTQKMTIILNVAQEWLSI